MLIDYLFRLPSHDASEARRAMRDLHAFASSLGVPQVYAVHEGPVASRSDPGLDYPDDVRAIAFSTSRYVRLEGRSAEIAPQELIAFAAVPAEGMRAVAFGLGYRSEVEPANGLVLPAEVVGWTWSGRYFGSYLRSLGRPSAETLVQAHLTVVAIFDRAAELGIEVRRHYWSDSLRTRDERRLQAVYKARLMSLALYDEYLQTRGLGAAIPHLCDMLDEFWLRQLGCWVEPAD